MNLSCIFKIKKLVFFKVNGKEFILFFLEREGLKVNLFMILKL